MNSASLTSVGGAAKNLIPNLCRSTGRFLRRRRRRFDRGCRRPRALPLEQSGIAGMSRLDEELRLLDQAVGYFLAVLAITLFVAAKQVMRELAAREAIEEELGVVEAATKLGHHRL